MRSPGSDAPTADVVRRIVEQTVYTPVRQGDLVAEAVSRLGQAISMGLLRPGDRLPPEARLADDLGISAVSLRSALTMLRGAGLLETRRGRGGGTVVTSTPPPRTSDQPLPDADALRDLADYRGIIEGGAAALAAERATVDQITHLLDLSAAMLPIVDFHAWSEQDTLLHLVIADASGSPRLVAEVARLRAEVFGIAQRLPVPRPVADLANREHHELIAAIAAHDPERARTAMVRHVESTRALWLGLGVRPPNDAHRS